MLGVMAEALLPAGVVVGLGAIATIMGGVGVGTIEGGGVTAANKHHNPKHN